MACADPKLLFTERFCVLMIPPVEQSTQTSPALRLLGQGLLPFSISEARRSQGMLGRDLRLSALA